MTDCAGCGDCCETIILGTSPEAMLEHAEQALAHPERYDDSPVWIVAHWTPVREAPDATGRPGYQYACRRFDTETRRCTAYDDRPGVCRGYPWYGKTLPGQKRERAQNLAKRCSHLIDVAPDARPAGSRPLLPLTVL